MSRAATMTEAPVKKPYSTGTETAAELNISFNDVIDAIRTGGLKPPARYIRGEPEWDLPTKWQGNSREGFTYLAGYGSYVKIGFTSENMKYRIASLQTGSPETIEVFASLPGTMAVEAALHRRFAEFRLRGEWFRREGDLAAWISEGCK